MESLVQDLRYAARALLRSPGTTAAAVVSLALGIAVNATIFTWIDAVLLRPLPGVDARDLVAIDARSREEGLINLSYPAYEDYRDAAIFGGLALALAAVGLYGVLAYSVAQRIREIGVRMAVGARPADVVRLVTRQGMGLVGAGLGLGLAASIPATKALAGMLVGVDPIDPLTLASVAGLLVAVALLACALPAHRASRVDPLRALRWE